MGKKEQNAAEGFFNVIGHRDVKQLHTRVSRFAWIVVVLSFIVTIFALLTTFAALSKPTPVIAFDSDGKRMVFPGKETLSTAANQVRIERFISDFINKYEGVSPHVDKDLADAYNSLTPRFRQIVLDKGTHKEKIGQWKNRNIQSSFKLINYRLKGTFTVGSTVAVEGVGEFSLAPAVNFDDAIENPEKEYIYFTALLLVTPISLEISPDGLLVDFLAARSSSDFRQLRAYLLEHKKEYLLPDNQQGEYK
ncbi:hypothetical protein KAH37_07920 [bacterium]|nr:hypothetical protein [bacterium]